MSLVYNQFVWAYLISALTLLITFFLSLIKKTRDYLWLIIQLMVMFWCIGFALQISCTDLKDMFFWYVVANDFVGMKVPCVLLMWSLVVTGRKKLISRFRMGLVFAMPVVTDILNITNHIHGLMYRKTWVEIYDGNTVLHYEMGYWYWVITVYCCILLFVVSAMLINDALNRRLLYNRHGMALSLVTMLVLLSIIVVLGTKGSLFNYYDPTPLIISAIVVGPTFVFWFRKPEPVPVSRNIVMDRMTSAVLILDDNNRIMDMNSTAEGFLGLKAKTVSGSLISAALKGWDELVRACVDNTAYSEFSRDQCFYKVYISALSDEYRSAGKVVIIQDVTEFKKSEARAKRQEQALIALQERDRLARELHDSLGQVLGYINMQIEIIRKMLRSREPELIDDSLVSLSKVVEEANTEVREFIYEVRTTLIFKEGFFTALYKYLRHFEHSFKISVETRNPDGITDEEISMPAGVQLFRIIQEALSNVRKHAQADRVVIRFRRENGNIVIRVTDNGSGFNPEEVRGKASFGLSVMKERAANIGGMVKIDSAPDMGTTVSIIFPYLAAPAGEPGTQNRPPEDERKIKVLLADDHVLFMEGVQKLIEQYNFEVVGTARDGYEALEKSRILHPEIILMDLQMPRCNGITATRLIKMEMPDIKIIILTMSDREQDLFMALKNGASGYLLKGLCTEDFIEQLVSLATNKEVITPEIAARVMDELDVSGNEDKGDSKTAVLPNCLSQRQIGILSMIAGGLTYKEVASKLFISERTVKYEMSKIMKTLHLKNRSEALAYAQRAGLLKDSV